MSWLTSWPASIKKRACRYLLQHYLGQFLQEKLHLDQLSVDLYNGTGHVNNVALDIWALNSMLDQAHVPMELVDGFIGSIEVSIPWSALLKDNCKVEIKGLEVTLQPKYRTDADLNDMTDSFYRSLGSMTTSMQLAEGCLKEEEGESEDSSGGKGLFEGLEVFAQTIETVLSRVKVSLTDMVIRIEHLPESSKNGVALEMCIDRIDYFDEITMEDKNDASLNRNNAKSQNQPGDKAPVFQGDSITCKHFQASGVKIYLDEFPEHLRTSPQDSPHNGSSSPINISDIPEFQTMTDPLNEFIEAAEKKVKTDGPLLIGKFFGKHELKLRIRQNEHVTTPKIDAECYLGSCGMFLTPHQVHLLAEFVNGIASPVSANPTCPPQDEFTSLQTNNFATCTEGIRLSPNVGGDQSDAMEEMRRHKKELNEKLHGHNHPHPDVEENEQFFSMEGSRIFSQSPPEPSEYSEYGASVYSQSTGYTPSSYSNRSRASKVPSMHPSSKLMCAGHHHYGEGRYSFSPSSPPRELQRMPSGRDDDKSATNHCRYQLQIRALALTILHINPLSGQSHKDAGLDSDLSATPHPSTGGSDVDVSLSTLGSDSSTLDLQNFHKELSEKYFCSCERVLDEILKSGKNISSVRSDLASVCSQHDHLRFVAAHIHLNAELKASHSINTELSLGRAEITECLFTDTIPMKAKSSQKSSGNKSSPKATKRRAIHSEILVFHPTADIVPSTKMNSDPQGVSPNIRIHISSHETSRSIKTSLYVHLSSCESEVDISIVDRISTILYPSEDQPKMPSTDVSLYSPTSCYTHSNPDAFNRQTAFHEALTGDTKEKQFHFNVSASFLRINFRFPIADLRPEMERRPWYARSLRDETLILEAHDISFLTSLLSSSGQASDARHCHTASSSGNHRQEFEVTVKDLHVLYSDEPDRPKSFLRISQSPADMEPQGGPIDANSDLDCPHIKVTIKPAQQGSNTLLLQDSTTEHIISQKNEKKYRDHKSETWYEEDFPLYGSQESTCDGNPSPFSHRKVIYDNKEMILPGDSNEISNFSDHAISTSLVSISIQLPAVNVFLVSKSFFENLYNRINNDILLWAPAAPKPHGKVKSWFDSKTVPCVGDAHLQYPGYEKGLDFASQLLVTDEPEEDFLSSDSDSDDEIRTNYSGRPSLLGASRRVVKSVNENSSSQQSLISISTKIGYGRVTAKCIVINPDGTTSQMDHGEVVIMLENANIFNVASYCGNPLLDYVCIQIAKLDLYHKASIPSFASIHPTIQRLSVEPPSQLDKVVTRCEEGISKTFDKNHNDSQNMLVLAIKIETEEDKPMKQCLIAASVNDAMLHHRFAKAGYSWLEQIIDFVDATDDDVLGYKPPSFITEVHLNVNNSAAVYKPLNMVPPVSAVLTESSLTLSSNIVAGAAISILDIIIDEAKLYITDQCDASDIDLISDYACVVDVNFFEVCLKLSNPVQNPHHSSSVSTLHPLIDFQASNNLIMFHTCADSCAALGALVRYLADDGDLGTKAQEDDDSATDYQSQVGGVTSGWTDQENPIVEAMENLDENSDDDDDDLSSLMTDAMEDIFEDAPSEFGTLQKKPVSAMTESMYGFSATGADTPAPLPRKKKDIMSQSFILPRDQNIRRITGGSNSHVFAHRDGQDLYFSAFHKLGVCHNSERPDDDDFCIIDDELGTSHQNSEPEITYRSREDDQEETARINITENHFRPTFGKVDQLQAPEHFSTPVLRYALKELSCIWYMHGGYDFQTSNIAPRKNSGSGLRSSPMKCQSSPVQYNARKRNVNICKQGSSRDPSMLMEVHLTKVRAQFEQYPEDTLEVARTAFSVSDFEVRDKLKSSNINKFLYRFHSEASPRQSHAKALLVKILQIRPEGAGTPTESKLRISLQPLRLNVDQDTLNFLTKFFSEVSSSVSDENGLPSHWIAPGSAYETAAGSTSSAQNRASPKNLGTPYASPVMTRPKSNSISAQGTVFENSSTDLPNGASSSTKNASSSEQSVSNGTPLQPTFFREVIFSPEVPIRLDYHGKRIDTEQGTISGLLMGLGQLNCSQLKLKRVVHRHGVLGVDKLIAFLLNEWAADIRANQLPLILGGVGPMHSVVQLFKGVRDLVYLPVEQYRKDGRIVRGLQRGATSFGTSTAMATLEITNRAIGMIQSAAETAYELVSPHELHRLEVRAQRNWRTLGNHAIRRQPADIREGVSNAFSVVKQGVEDTAGAIVRAAQKEHERRGMTAAVGGVVRHIPSTLVRPVILATEATSNVLSGIRNQIQPDAKQQDEDKWKNLDED